MIKVTKADGEQKESDILVTADDILKIIDNNRTRIRTLSSIVLSVCGLLLSTSFVVLLFILNNAKFYIPRLVSIILFATSASLTCAIVCSVLSALLPIPMAVATKLELIDFWTKTYRQEYRRVTLAVCFLIVAIILFVIALGILSSKVMS